jgi:hypothetical protein
MGQFLQGLLSNCFCCSLLKAAHPEQFSDKVHAGPGVPPSSLFFSKGCALDIPSFILEGATPSPPFSHSLSATQWKTQLLASQPPTLESA